MVILKKEIWEKLIGLSLSRIINKNKKEFLGEVKIYFEKDFLKINKGGIESKIPWLNLKLEQNGNYIYLYTTTVSALIIPLNKINKKETFISFIKNKLN